MWGRSSSANTSKGMNIEYQRIGENNEDIFVDPFAGKYKYTMNNRYIEV